MIASDLIILLVSAAAGGSGALSCRT